MSLVTPAVLPSSRADLEEKLKLFASFPPVSRIQVDVVDGDFAAPASWPYSAPEEFAYMQKRGETLPYLDRISYEADLMCRDAEGAVGAWIALGASRFTLHVESTTDLPQLLRQVRRRYGAGADFASELIAFGVALHIASDLARIEPVIGEIQYVQFMGIARIGRQGELLDERVYENVRICRERYPDLPLQVDGGVTLENARKLVALGITNLVIGSGLLRSKDPLSTLTAFEAFRNPYGV